MIITKDDREIELMTEAGRIVALVHEKLKEVIVPGITTNEIDQICDKIIREHGATPSFLHLYGFPNSVCTSINEVVVHGIPSNRKLKDGDIISIACEILESLTPGFTCSNPANKALSQTFISLFVSLLTFPTA